MTVTALWNIIVAICAGIASIGAAWKIIKPALVKPISELNEKIDALSKQSQKSDQEIQQSLKDIDEQVGTIQREKMMWAYSHYGIQQNPITIETKVSLQAMYDQYTHGGKHNHIPQDFKARINSAPIDMGTTNM